MYIMFSGGILTNWDKCVWASRQAGVWHEISSVCLHCDCWTRQKRFSKFSNSWPTHLSELYMLALFAFVCCVCDDYYQLLRECVRKRTKDYANISGDKSDTWSCLSNCKAILNAVRWNTLLPSLHIGKWLIPVQCIHSFHSYTRMTQKFSEDFITVAIRLFVKMLFNGANIYIHNNNT